MTCVNVVISVGMRGALISRQEFHNAPTTVFEVALCHIFSRTNAHSRRFCAALLAVCEQLLAVNAKTNRRNAFRRDLVIGSSKESCFFADRRDRKLPLPHGC